MIIPEIIIDKLQTGITYEAKITVENINGVIFEKLVIYNPGGTNYEINHCR